MNAISTTTARQRKLEKLESEIAAEAYEAFYHIGQKLLEIRRDKLYEDAGYKSWSAYCAAGRIEYRKTQADDLIRASELRPKIARHAGQWNIRPVLELCKCTTDKDAQRVAKKAVAQAKKLGTPVTAKLVAGIRDGDGETGRAARQQQTKLQAASLQSHLTELADLLVDWRTSLEQVPLEQWDSVPSEVLARVKNEANALSRYLRS